METEPTASLMEFLQQQPDDTAVTLLEALTPTVAAELVLGIEARQRRPWLSRLDPARCAVIVSCIDEPQRSEILAELDPSAAREVRAILTFPPDTAGAMMDTRVTRFRAHTTADAALSKIRELRHLRISNVHVVDGRGGFLGSVRVQDLAVANPDQRLQELLTSDTISVQATAPRADVVELLETYRQPSLPVVDFDGRLIGVVRHDALLSAVEAEATADVQAMVGASRDERALSPVSFAVKKRLPWLQINLLTAFLASFVVGLFEDTIAQFTALAVLLPVVAGQSGNTGAQALAVTMRGLALREIRTRQAARVSLKESAVGAVNGVAVAAVTAAAVYLWSRSIGLAAVIAIAMVISMLVAGLAGATIPMVLTMLGQDPAQSSSIVLTTVTDVVGFLSFLGLATLMMGSL